MSNWKFLLYYDVLDADDDVDVLELEVELDVVLLGDV